MLNEDAARHKWSGNNALKTVFNPLANAHVAKTDILNNVIAYSRAGLAVIRLTHLKKLPPFNWRNLGYVRINWHDQRHAHDLEMMFAGVCNYGAFTGRASGNLVVLDFDTDISFELAIYEWLKRFKTIYSVKSSRGGHIYFRSKRGPIQTDKKSLNKIDILCQSKNGNGHIVVLPGSQKVIQGGEIFTYALHPDSDNEIPVIDHKVIDWLRDSDGKAYELKLCKHKKKKAYDPLTLDYFENGDKIPPDTERNTRLFAAAGDMRRVGDTEAFVTRKLWPIAWASGLGDEEIHKTLNSAFESHDPARPQPGQGSSLWQIAAAYAESVKWSARGKDQEVFLAMVRCSREQGCTTKEPEFIATQRTLMRYASIKDRKTVKLVIERLVKKAGLILRVNQGKQQGMNRAGKFRFSDKVMFQYPPTCPKGTGSAGYSGGFLKQPNTDKETLIRQLAEREALKPSGTRVYLHICEQVEGVSDQDIHKTTGIGRTTVYRATRELEKKNLIYRDRDGKWLGQFDTSTAAQVVSDSGTATKAQELADKINFEREENYIRFMLQGAVAIDKNMPLWVIKQFNADKEARQERLAKATQRLADPATTPEAGNILQFPASQDVPLLPPPDAKKLVENDSLVDFALSLGGQLGEVIDKVEFTPARDKPAAGD